MYGDHRDFHFSSPRPRQMFIRDRFGVCDNSLSFASLESFTSFVVQSLLVEDWTLDTSSDFNPNMWFSSLTDSHLLMNFLSTKEFTVLIIFPHVPYGFLS